MIFLYRSEHFMHLRANIFLELDPTLHPSWVGEHDISLYVYIFYQMLRKKNIFANLPHPYCMGAGL